MFRVSVKRGRLGWSRFRPWDEFIKPYLLMNEIRRRQKLADPSVQLIREDDSHVSTEEVISVLDRMDVELFEKLETKLDFENYVRENPMGKFAHLANRRLKKIELRTQPQSEQIRSPQLRWHCFLGHSASDRLKVRELKARLQQESLDVWIDEDEILPGDQITQKIEAGLKGSQFVVVCLSSAFVESKWCRPEYSPFLNDEITRDSGARVIPLELDPVREEDIPRLLSDKSRVRYYESDGWNRFVRVLKTARAIKPA